MNCLVLLLTLVCVVSTLPLTKRSQKSARGIELGDCFTSVTTEGEISSDRARSRGGKWGRYAPNLNCSWSIQAPVGQKVRLDFTVFVVQRQRDCYFDYVKLFNGDSLSSPLFSPVRMCGHRPTDDHYPNSPYISSGRNMFVLFKTNDKIQQRGWNATVTFVGNGITFQPEPMSTTTEPLAIYEPVVLHHFTDETLDV